MPGGWRACVQGDGRTGSPLPCGGGGGGHCVIFLCPLLPMCVMNFYAFTLLFGTVQYSLPALATFYHPPPPSTPAPPFFPTCLPHPLPLCAVPSFPLLPRPYPLSPPFWLPTPAPHTHPAGCRHALVYFFTPCLLPSYLPPTPACLPSTTCLPSHPVLPYPPTTCLVQAFCDRTRMGGFGYSGGGSERDITIC